MRKYGFAESFAQFGAELRNVQWAVSAEGKDGDLVISLWWHYFSPPKDGTNRYTDTLSRFAGPGNNLLRQHITQAYESGQRIRAVVVRTDETNLVDSGTDASKIKKSFSPKKNWEGRVVEFNGDRYIIEFSES